ncbi:MAG: sensor histidine kinase [Deltaproteobacteria bacterium]|nr:sensor histidine kinase [Deltaproteobacteria bacterium]
MGETRVDLLHLLEDLRDAYPGALEETILTEIIANALDSGARLIRLATDAAEARLTVVDDGRGMQRRELSRYHDVAASTKNRGDGIGFAGVGIKLGLLVCEEVLTETRRGKTHVATRWHLASRHRAPWKWVPPPGFVTERGTAVCLRLHNALSPLLDRGFLEVVLRRHFAPLLDPAFARVLAGHYPRGVRLAVNEHVLEPHPCRTAEHATLEVRLLRKRKPSASGYLLRDLSPLAEDDRGLAVSTLGKVIKRGWDWLGVTPGTPERVGGLIEAPALAGCLTLNKADFIRVGPRGATYLAYRKAIQESVSRQLAAWGDTRDSDEETRKRVPRPLARDIERVLAELADDFPLLASLVEQRKGGQRRLPMPRAGMEGAARVVALAGPFPHVPGISDDATSSVATAATADATPPEPAVATAGTPLAIPPATPHGEGSPALASPSTLRRPARLGLGIEFEARPGDPEIGRLVESTIWVNTAHPAHQRAVSSRSEGYHVALAVALALAALAVEPAKERAFVTAFLARWGESVSTARAGRRARR